MLLLTVIYTYMLCMQLCLGRLLWFNEELSRNTLRSWCKSYVGAGTDAACRLPSPCLHRPDLLEPRWEYESTGVCQRAQIGSLTSCSSAFLPFPFSPSPHPALSPSPKSNTKHGNTSVGPRCVWCCWGYPLRSLKRCLGDGDREGWSAGREGKTIWRRVPGWLCCVRPPTPDVTSFRFTSAAKLE